MHADSPGHVNTLGTVYEPASVNPPTNLQQKVVPIPELNALRVFPEYIENNAQVSKWRAWDLRWIAAQSSLWQA